MISWAAMDRIVAKKKKADPEYRRKLAGRPSRSDGANLSDEQLIDKLHQFNVEIDKARLERLVENALSAQEIVEPILDALTLSKQNDRGSEWIWICITELWLHWFPDQPCFERWDDKVQFGYGKETGARVAPLVLLTFFGSDR